jgi:hypothetical protein
MLRRRPIARLAVGTAVVAGTASAVGGRAARRQQANAPQAAPPPPQAAPAPPPAAPAAAPSDPIQRLTELSALKDKGVLTDEEFASLKAATLA